MKIILIILALFVGYTTNLWAALQTDTHTYIISESANAVLAINRQTGEKTRIPVGKYPQPMVIYGNMGYVSNSQSNNISVIDLRSNTVTHTIAVGDSPHSMVIHGNMGYVVNYLSTYVSVIDLRSNTVTHPIPVGKNPRPMVIFGELGYVVNYWSANVSVIDLRSNTMTQTIPVGAGPLSMVIHEGMGYVVNFLSKNLSVIDLSSNTVTQTIPVGESPGPMVIHGNMGYVANYWSANVSVIDLQTNTVTQTIAVRLAPLSLALHGEVGYVVNSGSNSASVIDLNTNTVKQTISVGKYPLSMVIHAEMGYVVNGKSDDVTVIDLQTNNVVTTIKNPERETIDFSDTHVYLGLKKARPLYPTLASINLAKAEKTLGEFVAIMPEIFKLGEIEPRLLPNQKNEFDTLPVYLLAQNLFWDLDTDKPLMDPKDILATLVTMKYPQKYLQTIPGKWLRNRLHMAFFQTVWTGDKDKAKTMLTYFVQLQDPVITKLAASHFKMGAKEGGAFKDALSE